MANEPVDQAMTTRPLTILELISEARSSVAFDIMRQLRPHLASLDDFMERLELQRKDGYRLAAGFADGCPVVVAGFRITCTMSRGPHLFVDDLVTDEARRGHGHGAAMIDWLRATARAAGLSQVWLDSRDTAVGFYEREGFTFSTSRPCFISASD